MGSLRRFQRCDAKDLAGQTLFYIINTANINDKKEFEKTVLTNLKNPEEPIMTYREHCIAEGMEKGIEKGRMEGKSEGIIEVAKNALKQGFSIETITQLTGLSFTITEKLEREVVTQ